MAKQANQQASSPLEASSHMAQISRCMRIINSIVLGLGCLSGVASFAQSPAVDNTSASTSVSAPLPNVGPSMPVNNAQALPQANNNATAQGAATAPLSIANLPPPGANAAALAKPAIPANTAAKPVISPSALTLAPPAAPVATTQAAAPLQGDADATNRQAFKQWLAGTSNALPVAYTGGIPIDTNTGAAAATGAPASADNAAINDANSQALQTLMEVMQARQSGPKLPRPLTYDQSQNAMLATLPGSKQPENTDADFAFNTLLAQNMPLSPQQVLKLRQQIDVAQRAAATPPTIPPKPVSSTIMVNLAPGTTPPAIRLAQGYVSALVFVDSTGSPWPIAAFDIGNPRALNIQWDGKSNILLMQSILPYSDGDMVVRLVGMPTPITLQLVSGQRVVDYRVDLHISGIGPNSKDLPMGTDLPGSANQLLLGVLDGVAPAGGREVNVLGATAQAWILGEKMYLRTRLTLLSPGWMGKMVSSDGMQAYELAKTSSILVSKYGEPTELRIEGF